MSIGIPSAQVAEPLRPWRTIWTQPRATVRHLVETDPDYMVLVLASLGGVAQVLDRASTRNLGDRLPLWGILLLALLVGPLGGIASLYIGAALAHWTGRWLGGVAPVAHLRTAGAWANVPNAWGLLLWVAAIALIGQEMFTRETPRLDSSPGLILLMMLISIAFIILGIWSFILLLKGVAEVQGFSAWRALGNVLLAGAVIVVPAVLVGLGIAIIVTAS